MRNCWERMRKIITYILAVSMLAFVMIPDVSYAADVEKKSAVTEDKILEMSSDSANLNKGDEVQLKFAIHNTQTYGFSGFLEYDTDVFEILEAGAIVPCSYDPKEDDNQGSWIASYSPTDKNLEVHWRGPKPVTLPDETKGVVLTIKLVVKKSAEITKISLNYPRVYKSNESTDSVSYPSGLALTLKNSKTKKLVLTTNDVNATGSNVMVPVSCSTNEGFVSLDLVVEFDKTKLSYQSVSVENAIKNYVSVVSYSTESGGNKVIVKMKASQEVKNIGNLFQVNFAPVKTGNTTGNGTASGNNTSTSTITDTVKLSVTNVKDQNENAFVTTGATSKVTVKLETPMLGDINGNKKIDLVDALYVVQYYNKVRYFTYDQKTAADVNKNGTVDMVDALLLMQYYNGAIKSFP